MPNRKSAPPKPTAHNPTPAERDERVSLYPLDPEKALAALLKVDPESDPVEDEHPST